MTITFTGTGGLFKRLGSIGGRYLDVVALMGGSATARVLSTSNMVTKYDTMQSNYSETTAINSTFDGAFQRMQSWQNGQAQFLQDLARLAADTIIRQVDDDAHLNQKTIDAALKELIFQMQANSASVNATEFSLGSQTNVGTPVGNAIVVVSTTSGKGVSLEYSIPETITIKCIADAQSGGATENREVFSITTPASVVPTTYNWPAGSGAYKSLLATDASQDNTTGYNLLTNGDMEDWCSDSSNTPKNWNVLVGTAGTNFFNAGGSDSYDGSGALKITGDGGGTLTSLAQVFDHAVSSTAGNGGTPAILEPEVPYAFNCWLKVSATPSAGVLRFRLLDGSNTVIADSASTNNSATKSLTGVSTSWVNFNGVFRLPASLPATIKLCIDTSTAIDSAKSVYIDRISFVKMQPLYTGGPYVAIFSGDTPAILNDTWTMALSASSTGTFQNLFDRWFDMRSKNLILPSVTGGTETIADSLVT